MCGTQPMMKDLFLYIRTHLPVAEVRVAFILQVFQDIGLTERNETAILYVEALQKLWKKEKSASPNESYEILLKTGSSFLVRSLKLRVMYETCQRTFEQEECDSMVQFF